MRIPKTVKIAGLEYQVDIIPQSPLATQYTGYHQGTDQKITVEQRAPGFMQIVFLHECVHGMFMALGHEQDEVLTEQLARQLYQFINDNPDMFKEAP